MDLIPALPHWALAVLALCLVGILMAVGLIAFGFLFKLGVIWGQSRKAPYSDAGDYRLEQGREVRSEQVDRTSGE